MYRYKLATQWWSGKVFKSSNHFPSDTLSTHQAQISKNSNLAVSSPRNNINHILCILCNQTCTDSLPAWAVEEPLENEGTLSDNFSNNHPSRKRPSSPWSFSCGPAGQRWACQPWCWTQTDHSVASFPSLPVRRAEHHINIDYISQGFRESCRNFVQLQLSQS